MSDTDVIRRALGQFKDDSDKQGDRAAIRNALDDTFYAAMDGIYKLPYAETPRPSTPAKPKPAPKPTPPTIPPRQAAPLPTDTGTPGGNWFSKLVDSFQNSSAQATQMLHANPGGVDIPDWLEGVAGGLWGGVSTGLGVVGDVAGTVNAGADWLDEGMKRAVNRGQLPADYKPFSQELADTAGQWNERIAEPLAGAISAELYRSNGTDLLPGNQNYFNIFEDIGKGDWNAALFGRPDTAAEKQYKEAVTAPSARAGQTANTALTDLQSGNVVGALEKALTAFNQYGNDAFDKLSPGDAFAAMLLFDPLNFIPGMGIADANKAAKLDDLTRAAKFVEKAEDLIPRSWAKTEAAKLTEMVKTGLDNLFVRTDTIADAKDYFSTYRRFMEAGKDAKAFDAIAKVMTGLDTVPAQRASRLLQGFAPLLDEVEAGFRATQTALKGAVVDAKTLPKAFSNFITDLKAGKPLTEADLLDVTKAEMFTRSQEYMAQQAAKLGKPRNLNAPTNLATRFMNNLKAAEALVYIGLSPFTFVRNVVNGFSTMALEGLNPLWDASAEIKHLKKLGQTEKAAELQRAVNYQKTVTHTGDAVRRAMGVGDAGTSQTGAFGSFMSRMINKTGKANPLHWYQQIENGMRSKVWTQIYWNTVNHGYDVGKMLPPMDAALGALLHAYRVPEAEIYNILKEAGLDEGKAIRAMRDFLRGKRGAALDYDKLAAEMGVTRQQLLSVLDEADQAKAAQMAQEVSARVANGEPQAQAANDVVAQAANETTAATAAKLGLTDIGADGLPVKAAGVEDAQLQARIAELAQQEQELGDELVRLQGSKTKLNKARRKEITELLGQIDEERTQLQEALGMTDEEILFGRNPAMPEPPKGAKVVTPEIKQAQSVAPPLESELPPVDIPAQVLSQGQQNARDYLLNIKRADGTPVYTAEQLATWKPETLENFAGELQTHRNTFDDIMLSAKNKGIPTATEKGAPNNRRLINTLNKHKAADAPRFERIDDVKARADETVEILNNYTPSGVKNERAGTSAAKSNQTNAQGIQETPTTSSKVKEVGSKGISDDAETRVDQEINRIAQSAKELDAMKQELKRRTMTVGEYPDRVGQLDSVIEGNPDKLTWQEYLSKLDLVNERNGVKQYRAVNSNYIVTPDGRVEVYYGYHGDAAFKRIAGDTPSVRNVSDASVRGIDPMEQHGAGQPFRQRMNATEAIETLRQVAQPDEAAEAILSVDEMVKAKARTQADLYEALLRLWSREDIRRVRVGTDAENKIFGYMRRDVFPRMNEVRQAATVAADHMDNAVMISRDGETRFDAALGLLSPFQFWRSRFALQSLRRVADRPARLAWYLKIREAQDQIQDDPRYPARLRGMRFLPIPFIPAWAGGGMFFDPLENITSLEQTFGVNRMEDEVTDAEIARSIRALAKRGQISMTDASNAIANQSGQLWDATKQQLTDLSQTSEGADSFSTMFRPHLPFDISWKLLTGTPEEIGVLFPMTRLIRGATGVNIERPIKAGLRALTGNQDIPDWDMWEQYRTDRALADMVGDGLISERDAMLALIEKRGEIYTQAQQRAKQQTAMQNWSVFGGQLFPTGEREYYKAAQLRRETLDQAVASLGVNPETYSSAEKWELVKANGLTKRGQPLSDFYKDNPVYGTRQSVYDEAEKRLKDFLGDEVWKRYNEKGALDKRLMVDDLSDLGDGFRENFLSDTRNLDNVTLDQLGEWVRRARGYVPQQEILRVGDFPQVRYGTLDQNERYGEIQSERDVLFDMDALAPKLDMYHNLTGDEKYAYRDTEKDMDAYLDWYSSKMKSNPDVAQLLNPEYQQSTGNYVNTRDGANDVTRYAVANLDNMIRRIGGRQGRGGGGGGAPAPNQPPLSLKLLTTRAQKEVQQKWADPRFFLSKDVYGELFALYRKYRMGAQSFEQWLTLFQQAVGGR